MNRCFFTSIILFESIVISAQSTDQNWIISHQLQVPIQTESQVEQLSVSENNRTIRYFDGLGRPIQDNSCQFSPDYSDIVQAFEYDQFGRDSIKYLPYSIQLNGLYDANYQANQLSFYSATGTGIPVSSKPFATLMFDNSPLNKVIEQGFPGETWQLGGLHTLKTIEGTNLSEDSVRIWIMVDSEMAESNEYYSSCQLYKVLAVNENGDSSAIYTDKEKRMILKESYLNGNKVRIYYVYDLFGLLRYVIQPEGEYQIRKEMPFTIGENEFTRKFCFFYRYDERKRLVEKKVPGQSPIIMEYDSRNRIISEEDGNLRQAGLKKYFDYDDLNRIIEEGITDGRSKHPRVSTFYDDYDFNNDGVLDYSYLTDSEFPGNKPASNNLGRSTGTRVRYLGEKQYDAGDLPSPFMTNAIFYDKYGRIIQTQAQNCVQGNEVITTEVDFVGKVIKTKQTHTSRFGDEIDSHILRKSYLLKFRG